MEGETRVAKVVMVGDNSVGKTSIVINFVTGQCDKFAEPTIGSAYHSKTMKTPQGEVKFQIWDTAGQEKNHSLIPMYYRGAYAAVIVYDVCRKSSFDMLHHWYEELTKAASSNVKMVVAGNNAERNEDRQVEREAGAKFAQRIGAEFFEVSAREGTNIRELFRSIADSLPPLDSIKDDNFTDDANALDLTGGDTSEKEKKFGGAMKSVLSTIKGLFESSPEEERNSNDTKNVGEDADEVERAHSHAQASIDATDSQLQQPDMPLTVDEVVDLRIRILPNTAAAVHRNEIPRTLEQEDEHKILQYIKADTKLILFYSTLNSTVNDYFVAAMAICTGEVALNSSQNEANLTSMLNMLLHGIPIASQVSSTLHSVVKKKVSMDIKRGLDNLLSVAPTHTEIITLIEQVTRRLTLALKDIHINKLESTRGPRGFLERVKNRILSKTPTTVYGEEGSLCGIAIVKLCMKGDVDPQSFNAVDLLNALGYDQNSVEYALRGYHRKAVTAASRSSAYATAELLGAINQRGVYVGFEATATNTYGAMGESNSLQDEQDANTWAERFNLMERESPAAERGTASWDPEQRRRDFDTLRSELEDMRGELRRAHDVARSAKSIAQKNQNEGVDVGNGNTAQQQVRSSGTSVGDYPTCEDWERLQKQVEEQRRQLHEVTDEVSLNRDAHQFEQTYFPWRFVLNKIKDVLDSHFEGEENHAWSRDPSAPGGFVRRRLSIAKCLQGTGRTTPESVSGARILKFFDRDLGLAEISRREIYRAFGFEEIKPAAPVSSEERKAIRSQLFDTYEQDGR